MILLIDNYDSFTYNLYQLAGSFCPDITLIRNDAFDLSYIRELSPSRIIISPGPGKPSDAGECEAVIREFAPTIPILGVCLGHQAICEALGGVVSYAKELMHGKQSDITLDLDSVLFKGMERTIKGARYHSLAAVREHLPASLRVTAETADGEIMAVEHNEYPLYGLQFHPESVLTPSGGQILKNFIETGGKNND
ncbi:MAG: aminodeoxychorismate/anthranilate synthase component II [Oscillospiraceae bacterium]|jgi:anthranilate synthase component 2|nr:aminodeoxychorismate/anthranilate synthase component II [Oscillospiraceae bacterium]